ncbi:CRISPR-associated ring nuclease Csm6 [Thiospirillum jenense]|uniref:TIGR02584 family CRISPR-associated protein n=1 Tax=Thiospirillum jenense TaxID=1653858 RepID=A0A839HBL3_9GAMM|nr:CRISPR-associated ring nuclease Csm6 [Thiospirillum jenense]MBB1125580.1 TIGR02584 family CRISPR-associated protein [Thiospirillum jenense]
MNHETHRILLAVTGLTPQIVTETLYALTCQRQPAWIPHEVHLITTATGAENARLNLLAGSAWFHRLCTDYQLPSIDFPVNNIHILTDASGQPLEDIRTQAHNTAAADFIIEMVRNLTADAQTELHVSIAGGRKTMGYYLGYALSLYGRPQDRLSHVLVSDPYETNRDFYYPTPYDYPIHSRRGDKEITVDARHAQVDLADIPFVQLRDGLPERLCSGRGQFSQIIETANRGLQAALLVINVPQQLVFADDEAIQLTKTEFCVLLWLAERAVRGERMTDWSIRPMVEEFLALVQRVFANPMDNEHERIQTAFAQHNYAPLKNPKYFQPHKTNINKKITQVLGLRSAERYLIVGDRQQPLVSLPLEPEQIEIIND